MQTIGHYVIMGEIARGGMGVVYRARDRKLERDVAVKVLLAESRVNPARRQRAMREARALAKLSHPNIVAIHETGESNGATYMVMDLVEGETLQERIERSEISERQAAQITWKLADALSHAHYHSILHRDVKPANIILSGIGEPQLTDFGLAKDLEASLTKLSDTGAILGTPGFWPPEQARGQLEEIGPHSDVYSLGATLYAALTRQPPVLGGTLVEITIATIERAPPAPSSLRPGLDRGLEAICLKCLEKKPQDRYETAEDLAWDLERYLSGQRPLALGRSVRKEWLVGLGVVAALVCGLALGLAVGRGGGDGDEEVAVVSTQTPDPTLPPDPNPPAPTLPNPTPPEPEAIAPEAIAPEPGPEPDPARPPGLPPLADPNEPVLPEPLPETTKPIDLDPERVSKQRQADAQKLAKQGMTARAFRAFDAAEKQFDGALELDPSCGLALIGKAQILNRKNHPDEALVFFRLALQQAQSKRERAETLYEIGYTLNEKKRKSEEAIGYFDRAIALFPNYGEAYRRRGEAKEGAGDLEGAVVDFELAIRYLGTHPKQRGKVARHLRSLREKIAKQDSK